MKSNSSTITTTKIKDCLIVTVGEDLSDGTIEEIKQTVLHDVHTKNCEYVIFELSALKIIDTIEFEELKEIIKMISTLGTKAMFVGLHSGIVYHLVSHNMDTSGISVSLDLNEALERLGVTSRASKDS